MWQNAETNIKIWNAALRSLRLPRNPVILGVFVSTCYLISLLPIIIYSGFDLSVFIVAGGRMVDGALTPSRIVVYPDSVGYDGQYYYRLALSPFSLETRAYGISLDSGAWRMQRILYPLLTHLLSAGRLTLIPSLLFLLNLVGIGVIAIFASRITSVLALSPLAVVSIVAWPGFFYVLSRDTTEIVAVVFLLMAIDCYVRDKIALFALLGSLAPLAKETSILFLAGVAAFEFFNSLKEKRITFRLILCGFALLPFLAWRETLAIFWQSSSVAQPAQNLGWPFIGYAQAIYYALTGARYVSLNNGMLHSSFDAASLIFVLGFIVACCICSFSRPRQQFFGLAVGWLMFVPLVSTFRPSGPLYDAPSLLRPMSELFVTGCLLFYRTRSSLSSLILIACEMSLWLATWASINLSFFRHFPPT